MNEREVGLEIFTVPEHPAASLGDQYGYYEEYVRGQGYFITRNAKGASVLGPKRHRGAGWVPRLRRLGRKTAQMAIAAPAAEGVGEGQEVPRPWRQRLSDREWHRAVQHTAVDVTLWVCGLATSAAFIKGAWWFVCL